MPGVLTAEVSPQTLSQREQRAVFRPLSHLEEMPCVQTWCVDGYEGAADQHPKTLSFLFLGCLRMNHLFVCTLDLGGLKA